MSAGAFAHVLRRIESAFHHGLNVFRAVCGCGWSSAWFSSRSLAVESWDWHREHGHAPDPEPEVAHGDGPLVALEGIR